MGGQPTDLGIEFREFARVSSFQLTDGVAAFEQIGQSLECRQLPFAQDGHSNPMLRSELSKRLGLLQQLQHTLGFEVRGVSLFHTTILPKSGHLTVQISGSTITHRRALERVYAE